MKPKISLITLGVDDIQRSKDFYVALGLPIHGDGNDEHHVMFEMEGTFLSIFPKQMLAEEAGVKMQPRSATDFALAHNVGSTDAVDRVMKEAAAVGAQVTRPAADTFWGGYAGYFTDPDGYLWSVAWNPFTDMT